MRLLHHYRQLDLGRRVAIRAPLSCLITLGLLRGITAIIHYEVFAHSPFEYIITESGLHILLRLMDHDRDVVGVG